MESTLPLTSLCGQLLVVGYQGPTPSDSLLHAARRGECGGFIVFKRNLVGEGRARIEALADTLEGISREAPRDCPFLFAIDQEGGRVARLGEPVLPLPSMRKLAASGDLELVKRAGRALGEELASIGFTMDFAPVLDVDSNPDNPIIGDRSFGREPDHVSRFALAFAAGLHEGGVLACGKHFPGHGDTDADSHLELPVVRKSLAEIEATELVPFLEAAKAKVPAFMTAHVLFPSLDPASPATLSHAISTRLAREVIGFEGVLVSDDLEMKALDQDVEKTAIAAVRAGCDMLLVCSDEALYARAHAALVREAERDGEFRARCHRAAERGLAMRRSCPPKVAKPQVRDAIFSAHAELRRELAALVDGGAS